MKDKFQYTLTGTLRRNEKDFELHYKNGYFNLSTLLNRIFMSEESNVIHARVMCEGKVLFNEDGILAYTKTAPKTYALAVNSNNLEEALDTVLDKEVEVAIYATALEGENYAACTNQT